jgi:hypothetical protein
MSFSKCSNACSNAQTTAQQTAESVIANGTAQDVIDTRAHAHAHPPPPDPAPNTPRPPSPPHTQHCAISDTLPALCSSCFEVVCAVTAILGPGGEGLHDIRAATATAASQSSALLSVRRQAIVLHETLPPGCITAATKTCNKSVKHIAPGRGPGTRAACCMLATCLPHLSAACPYEGLGYLCAGFLKSMQPVASSAA